MEPFYISSKLQLQNIPLIVSSSCTNYTWESASFILTLIGQVKHLSLLKLLKKRLDHLRNFVVVSIGYVSYSSSREALQTFARHLRLLFVHA